MALTEEQKKRIEENKKRALEKRQMREATNRQTAPSTSASTSVSSFYAGTSNTVSSSSAKGLSSMPSTSNAKYSKPISNSKSNSNSTLPRFGFGGLGSIPNEPKPLQQAKPKIVGKCSLISNDRFLVDIKYHSGVIAMFKATRNGSYNAKERNWSFSIQEHDELMRKLRPLKASDTANVHVESLPKWVIDTCQNFKSNLVNHEQAWDNIEPTIKDALMPFQKEGVTFALERKGRIMLADDMGLGKTIQVRLI